jgi:hypothetical protein
MPKSTRAEVERRVTEVFKLRLGGAAMPDIREYAGAQSPPWNVSDTQLYRYIEAADALMVKHFDAKAAHLLSLHLLRREQLYAHALSAGDFRTALAAADSAARLAGLFPLDKLKLKEAEEFERRLEALERRLGGAPAHAGNGRVMA